MKHLYRLALALIVLGFVEAAVFFMLAPDTVPAHYNAAGEIDRMGSKYEYIIFPIFAVVLAGILIPMAKRARVKKKENYELVEIVLVANVIIGTLLFDGIGAFTMLAAASYTEGAAVPVRPAMDWMRFISLLTGILLIILGNVMPKARKNALFGLRTKWSMSGDEVWRKSQRFGGFASAAAGALLLAAAMFLKGIVNLLAQTVILVLWVVICIMASCRYYKTEKSA